MLRAPSLTVSCDVRDPKACADLVDRAVCRVREARRPGQQRRLRPVRPLGQHTPELIQDVFASTR